MSAIVTTETFCTGKRGFASRAEAERAAAKTSRRRDVRLRVYKCSCCKQYHYGQSDRTKYADKRPVREDELCY